MSKSEANSSNAISAFSALGGKYLTFALSKERYALQILKVQEIIGMLHITQVPRTVPYLKGVINLRGKIIPLVDLRLKFGLSEKPYDEKTCTIVVQVEIGGKCMSVGIIVDTVLEVINFQASQLEPAPDYGMSVDSNFVLAIGRATETDIVILIDIERALSDAAIAPPPTGVDSAAAV